MNVSSWGRFPSANHERCQTMHWRHQPPDPTSRPSFLPYGLGRSYGDVCLNDGADLLLTRGLGRFIAFDDRQGILTAEAGVSLAEVLALTVPKGWFPPVTPGTAQVTLGGMVANDVHGKNHHHDGSFGHHVLELGLWRSAEGYQTCSPEQHQELFRATIGGLGMTGLITQITFKLIPITSPMMTVETHAFRDLDGFLSLTESSDQKFRYTVAWIDTCQLKHGCRGIFFRGNHSERGDRTQIPAKSYPWRMPFRAPSLLLNRSSICAFNFFYFHHHRFHAAQTQQHYHPFFYPLDKIANWNLLYGKRGPLQYQCVVPGEKALIMLFKIVAEAKQVSFLTVLKKFGSLEAPGDLSFPRPGFTLAMDFPISRKVFALCDALDAEVMAAGGAVYPAKDARMPAENFPVFFPNWRKWEAQLDRQFSSSFYRRAVEPNLKGKAS